MIIQYTNPCRETLKQLKADLKQLKIDYKNRQMEIEDKIKFKVDEARKYYDKIVKQISDEHSK
jgi:hypothetical protein